MLFLLLAILNWAVIENLLMKFIVALIIFVVVEIKRKNGSATRPMIVGEFISAFILIVFIIQIIMGLVYRFL